MKNSYMRHITSHLLQHSDTETASADSCTLLRRKFHPCSSGSSGTNNVINEPLTDQKLNERMEIVQRALDLGLELAIGNSRVRLFQAGQTVRMPSGYFQIDEKRLMCAITSHVREPSIYVDDERLWDWLRAAVGSMSDSMICRIGAACEVRQANMQFHGGYSCTVGLTVNTSNVVPIRPPVSKP